ncbi:tetratricopeptide repeat protein [Granulicella aggregans]|uniref:tetratricopeptide repeat protein n=1 Tax=Granulicella aggregans TaxID=474949 RepID=UPI0021E021FB|nr:tetratricopeptide repeat protein [Granulicella aggregans]
MPGTRLAALILAAFSITALGAQDTTATANQPSGRPAHVSAGPRPPLVFQTEEPEVPPVMHLCIARCFPIMWDKDHYINFGPENTSIYTVERFTRESIVMHRTDKGRFPLTADITGQISEDGNSVVKGKIVWTSGNSGSGPFTATWGSAIEDDQVLGQRRLLHIPCDASSRVSVAEASERAEQLLEANDLTTAICWMRIGATQGDAGAQGALASIFYRGVGVPVNIREAALWAEKASAQGNYLGEHVLSNMYAKGDAKPKDAAKAEYWRAKYEKDKLAHDRAEEEAKEAQRQRAQAQAQQNEEAEILLLRLLVGAFSADSDSGGGMPRNNGYGQSVTACHQGFALACGRVGEAPPPE